MKSLRKVISVLVVMFIMLSVSPLYILADTEESQPKTGSEEVINDVNNENDKQENLVQEKDSEETKTINEENQKESKNVDVDKDNQDNQKSVLSSSKEYKGIRYRISNGEVIVTNYLGNAKKLIIPSKLSGYPVTKISSLGDFNFSVQDLTIPGSVERIGDGAISMGSLKYVHLNEGLKTIGDGAFAFCTDLKSINIPSSVRYIGDAAFAICFDMTSINVSTGNQYYCSYNSALYNKDQTQLIKYPSLNKATTLTLPDSVTSIDDLAIINAIYLKNVNLSSNLKTIGLSNFTSCYSLTSIIIPDGVKSIGKNSFFECVNLAYVKIPSSVQNIGLLSFTGNYSRFYIYGEKDSYAYRYARGKGIPFTSGGDISFGKKYIKGEWLDASRNVVNINILGATKYEVYRANTKNGNYKKVGTITALVTDPYFDEETSFIDKNLKTGKTYYYKARGINTVNGKTVYTGYTRRTKAKVLPARVTKLKVKNTKSNNVKLTWKEVNGATRYKILRKDSKDGKYKKIKTTSKTKFVNKNLKYGKTYTYKVNAYKKVKGKNINGRFSYTKSITVK